MTISHWAGPSRRSAYENAYDATLEIWPIPFEHRQLPTPFGSVHAVVSGDPAGDPIVLIHAAALSAVQWYPQAAVLGATHRLYALDIPGDIGLSTASRRIRTRADAAGWLGGVLDALDIERAIFVGSSFGGFLSANFAIAHPDRVRALAMLGPAATVKPFRLLANLAIRAGNLVPMPFTVKPGLRGMMEGGLPDGRLVRQMEIGVGGFRYDRGGVYPGEIPDRELASIACPTLLVVGSKEKIYDPVSAVERARRLIPNVRTEIVSGAGHLPGLQLPDVVNPLILDFLASVA